MLGYMYDVGWYVSVRACVYSYDGVCGCGMLVCTRRMVVGVCGVFVFILYKEGEYVLCCNVCRSLQYVQYICI
jgi:hypothetical protein